MDSGTPRVRVDNEVWRNGFPLNDLARHLS